ncbi:hypothetical protein Salat_0167100 [Sesamum alatum]|uniref:Uncharacterized protein n=1 Tax=Sesamum alatum TaxID=300844 RepID=A0AAE1YYX9_9LAMI|nr:hypothetical protein Salat_0167100 [Sesamum alatum]
MHRLKITSFPNNMARQQILFCSHSHKPISKRPQAIQLLLQPTTAIPDPVPQPQVHPQTYTIRARRTPAPTGRQEINRQFQRPEEPVQEASTRQTVRDRGDCA